MRLELRGAALRVPGRTLLRRAELQLDDGLVALVGANGAGKSELLRCVVGLRRPDAGRVRLDGVDPARAPAREVARRVGYVPQHAGDHLTEATVRREIGAVARAVGGAADVEGTAEALGVARLLDRHPWSLSGGERERVAVAAAVAHDPGVVVLDEPTTGLDADGRARLLRVLRRPGRLVLVATHEDDLAAHADRVLRMEAGTLVEGAPRVLPEVLA